MRINILKEPKIVVSHLKIESSFIFVFVSFKMITFDFMMIVLGSANTKYEHDYKLKIVILRKFLVDL